MAQDTPAFQFYPKDFLSSQGQASLSLVEAGAYIRLLCHCWIEGSVPDDAEACARLVGATPAQMARMWPKLAARFQPVNGVLRHRRLDLERQKQDSFRELQRLKGKASARARKQPRLPSGSNRKATARQPDGNSSSPISDLRSSSSSSEEEHAASPLEARVHAVLKDAEALRETVIARRAELKAHITALRVGFDAFWQVYPKKVGKDTAWKAWQRRHPTDELAAMILAALAWQIHQDAWLERGGKFVPNPTTWLNGGRWQDEPSTTPCVNERTLAAMRATQEFLDS